MELPEQKYYRLDPITYVHQDNCLCPITHRSLKATYLCINCPGNQSTPEKIHARLNQPNASRPITLDDLVIQGLEPSSKDRHAILCQASFIYLPAWTPDPLFNKLKGDLHWNPRPLVNHLKRDVYAYSNYAHMRHISKLAANLYRLYTQEESPPSANKYHRLIPISLIDQVTRDLNQAKETVINSRKIVNEYIKENLSEKEQQHLSHLIKLTGDISYTLHPMEQ